MKKEEIVLDVVSVITPLVSALAFLASSEPDANTKLFCRKKVDPFAFFFFVLFSFCSIKLH